MSVWVAMNRNSAENQKYEHYCKQYPARPHIYSCSNKHTEGPFLINRLSPGRESIRSNRDATPKGTKCFHTMYAFLTDMNPSTRATIRLRNSPTLSSILPGPCPPFSPTVSLLPCKTERRNKKNKKNFRSQNQKTIHGLLHDCARNEAVLVMLPPVLC
jgi:hypothetical protein